MTATQSWNLGTGVCVELECDDCGYVLAEPGAGPGDWPAVWRAAHHLGWHGSPRARGPHRCPECVLLEIRELDVLPRRRDAGRVH